MICSLFQHLIRSAEICAPLEAYAERVSLELTEANQHSFCAKIDESIQNAFFLFYKYYGVKITIRDSGFPGDTVIDQDNPHAAYKFSGHGEVHFTSEEDQKVVFTAGYYPQTELFTCTRTWMSNINGDSLKISPTAEDADYRPREGEDICIYFATAGDQTATVQFKPAVGSILYYLYDLDPEEMKYKVIAIDDPTPFKNQTILNEYGMFVYHVSNDATGGIEISFTKSALDPTTPFRGFYGDDNFPPEYKVDTPTKSSPWKYIFLSILVVLLIAGGSIAFVIFYKKKKAAPKYLPVQDVEYELKDNQTVIF